MKNLHTQQPDCQKAMDYSWGFIFGLVSDSQSGLVLANVPLGAFADNNKKKHRNR